MQRSEINAIMAEGIAFLRSFDVKLPPFAWWSPDEMRARRQEIDGIVARGMGWDITDFGAGRFAELGLLLLPCETGGGRICAAEAGCAMPKSF